jgi:hypothetical protein
MSYRAQFTCNIVTPSKGRRRTHEQGPDGRAICIRINAAMANHTLRPLGPGEVDCVRCARTR